MKKSALLGWLVFAVLFVIFQPQVRGNDSVPRATDEKEYIEYENLVVTPFSDSRDASIPNWRALYLKKAERYEAYMTQFPDSLLVTEVKLRLAEIYKDVEREGIYLFRLELYECTKKFSQEHEGTFEERKICIEDFYKKTEKWRDPVYTKKAVALLLELIKNHGHARRYAMQKPHIGGFAWVDEEIGAQALYLLSKGADPGYKKGILLLILEDYKVGSKLQKEIDEDLKGLEAVKPSAIGIDGSRKKTK
ncbi:MAG: hypothetical protein Q7R91_01855 [bacterium]|nr:hypothetical protein [bacterium]